MGTVISAKVVLDDSGLERPVSLEQVGEVSSMGRVEFMYSYGPHLLPPLAPSNDGMWRYQALLPVQNKARYPLAVGATPLLAPANLRAQAGIASLWLKDETRSPTGSNKDRATAIVLEQALQDGVRTVTCASTGNVAVSLAAGAAASGIEAVIFVPACVADAKLQLMLLSGAKVFKVAGGYEAAVELSRQAACTFGWYDRNTGYNPCTLEAKKTVALEIWEQLGRQVPDVVLCPVGDGVTLSGIAKGFRELMWCGATERLPRLIGVQAEGCQPLKRAWEGRDQATSMPTGTIADGIAVAAPINAPMVLRDVRESGGSFIAVSDRAMLQAISVLAAEGGIWVEPAGAAAFAGVACALTTGLLERNERVVVLITGTGLKNPRYLSSRDCNSLYEVEATLEEVERSLVHC
ncbi:MAG TPA: threonine synthase [Ktedonobacteraceae bacterium]|nr:threonine synthase [Ktedonobacteraceae bacterium]